MYKWHTNKQTKTFSFFSFVTDDNKIFIQMKCMYSWQNLSIYYKRLFGVSGSNMWNALNENTSNSTSVAYFKEMILNDIALLYLFCFGIYQATIRCSILLLNCILLFFILYVFETFVNLKLFSFLSRAKTWSRNMK